jgi:hypothetical protein
MIADKHRLTQMNYIESGCNIGDYCSWKGSHVTEFARFLVENLESMQILLDAAILGQTAFTLSLPVGDRD